MKRAELESFIMETYNAETDYPWLKYPNYEVFRHCNNRKWFALIYQRTSWGCKAKKC